ncbi:MAG: periplasmic heavy metal sensor [Thermodesulfobacteriota bacterium]|nr:periplasmic heavy metal sensor [Thermodesulfobacteriota bacterium]
MTKLTSIVGILLLVFAVAVPVMAWGPGWGRGHMMGYGNNGPGDYYGNVTREQREKLEALDREFYDETRDIQEKLWTKQGDLEAILNTTEPDLEKAKAVQSDISRLRASLDEKRLAYQVEVRKITPNQRAYGHGGRYNQMGPYGMGYTAGHCWN